MKKKKTGRTLEYTFLQRRHMSGKRYMRRCSTSLIIREMQIKTSKNYYIPPVEMVIYKKNQITKVAEVMKKKEPFWSLLLVGM